MSLSDETLGVMYRQAASERGYIYDRFNRPTIADTVFNFYINSNGDMQTVSDPFALAQLVILGYGYTDENGYGDYRILLSLYASKSELSEPRKYCSDSYGMVQWDYEFMTTQPCISLRDWLVRELGKAQNLEQRRIRHEFMLLLSKIERSQMGWKEKYLWWLPKR